MSENPTESVNTSSSTVTEQDVDNSISIETVPSKRKPYVMTEKRKETLAKANAARNLNKAKRDKIEELKQNSLNQITKIYEEAVKNFNSQTIVLPEKVDEMPFTIEKVETPPPPVKESEKEVSKPVEDSKAEDSSSSDEEVVVKKDKKKGKTVKVIKKIKVKHVKKPKKVVYVQESSSSSEEESEDDSSSEEEQVIRKRSKEIKQAPIQREQSREHQQLYIQQSRARFQEPRPDLCYGRF